MNVRVAILLFGYILGFFNFIEVQSNNDKVDQINISSIAETQNSLDESSKITLYQTYVWTKEILYIYFVMPFLGYYDFAKTSKIYCSRCGCCVDSFELYCALIARGESSCIAILKKCWEKKSISVVENFMCKCSNDLHIPCIPCLAYHGWCMR